MATIEIMDHTVSHSGSRYLTQAVLYMVTIASLMLWMIILLNHIGLGDIFRYKGPTACYRRVRQLLMLSWWVQPWAVYIAFTWQNYLIVDALTIVTTLLFGGGFYDDWSKPFGIKCGVYTNYLLSVTIQLAHHGCIAYFILFESEADKALYRWVLFSAWFAHFMCSATWKFEFARKLSEHTKLFQIYHYSFPLYVLYWYLYVFGASQNEYISPGLLMLAFGRYTASYCVPLSHPWRIEGYLVVLFVSSAFCFGKI